MLGGPAPDNEILTVGRLREILDGIPDDFQVVVAQPDGGWYWNVEKVIRPASDQSGDYMAVTIFPGKEIDARQF
jgi:hypothetical protein